MSIGMILLAILLVFMAILWFGVTVIPVVVLGVLAILAAVFILVDTIRPILADKQISQINIGLILLAVLLIGMALLWFGVGIPAIALGVLAIITAIFLLIGR